MADNMQEEGSPQESGEGAVACVCFLVIFPLFFLLSPVIGAATAPIFAILLIPILNAMARSVDAEHRMDSSTEIPLLETSTVVQLAATPILNQPIEPVQILRGGDFVSNRLRFKVKVLNRSKYVITDITVSLVSYPRDALKVEGMAVNVTTKIDPNGFVSPTFDFLPSKDCIKGVIVASVSYVDHEGKPHVAMTDPFPVRAVCDLLMPEVITPEEFELRLSDLNHEEMTFKVVDWTPEEMRSKTLQVLEKSNFSEVTSSLSPIGEQVELKITGWARGKYTGNNLAVEVTISGRSSSRGAICTVRMSGEDQAMILPAIDEMSQKLIAWLCPMCGGDIPANTLSDIREGRQAKCPFCGITLSR